MSCSQVDSRGRILGRNLDNILRVFLLAMPRILNEIERPWIRLQATTGRIYNPIPFWKEQTYLLQIDPNCYLLSYRNINIIRISHGTFSLMSWRPLLYPNLPEYANSTLPPSVNVRLGSLWNLYPPRIANSFQDFSAVSAKKFGCWKEKLCVRRKNTTNWWKHMTLLH